MSKFHKRDLEIPQKVKLFTGIMVNNKDLVKDVEKKLINSFSKIGLRSEIFPFDHSTYYNREMGEQIFKYFLSFEDLIEKISLPSIKIETMKIEDSFLDKRDEYLCRNVNIDPGYLSHGKVILATSKNYTHRVYLGEGVFAELTYTISKDGWQILNWTYPDYREKKIIDYFEKLRQEYMIKIKV